MSLHDNTPPKDSLGPDLEIPVKLFHMCSSSRLPYYHLLFVYAPYIQIIHRNSAQCFTTT